MTSLIHPINRWEITGDFIKGYSLKLNDVTIYQSRSWNQLAEIIFGEASPEDIVTLGQTLQHKNKVFWLLREEMIKLSKYF